MAEKQKKTGDRSSFAVTCSLLSQFLKENRSFRDVGIEKLRCSFEKEKDLFRAPTTMNLFPGSNDLPNRIRNESELDKVSEQTTTMPIDLFTQLKDSVANLNAGKRGDQMDNEINSQLTIFYDGKVIVFDNFPAKKVEELMEMASKGKAVSISGPTSSLQNEPSDLVDLKSGSDLTDLTMPIARRASLHRFLEKRKGRINYNAPYFIRASSELDAAPVESKKNEARLGLAQQPSFYLGCTS